MLGAMHRYWVSSDNSHSPIAGNAGINSDRVSSGLQCQYNVFPICIKLTQWASTLKPTWVHASTWQTAHIANTQRLS